LASLFTLATTAEAVRNGPNRRHVIDVGIAGKIFDLIRLPEASDLGLVGHLGS